MEASKQKMLEVKKNKLANVLKVETCVFTELSLTADMLKSSLARDGKKK